MFISGTACCACIGLQGCLCSGDHGHSPAAYGHMSHSEMGVRRSFYLPSIRGDHVRIVTYYIPIIYHEPGLAPGRPQGLRP